MGDQYILEESLRSELENEVFSSKQYIYINDSNAGTYTGNQVVFDLSQFFNSGKYISPKEMFLTLPIVLVMSQSVAADGLDACDFGMAIKSGFWNFIQSIQVSYRNQDVVQLTPNINYYVSYKCNTTFSRDQLTTSGSQLGFYPDTDNSWKYEGAPSASGHGSENNKPGPSLGSTITATYDAKASGNVGMFQRQLTTNMVIGAGDGSATLSSNNNLRTEFVSHQEKVRGAANARTQDYNALFITAIVRLKDLCDFFDKMPLTRGFYARLIINLNLGNLAIGVDNTGVLTCANGTNTFTNTCPFLVAPTGSGLSFSANTARTVYVGAYLVRVSGNSNQNNATLNVPNHSMNQCRVYAPIVDLLPEYALSYNESNKNKLIEYTDVYATSLLNIASGTTFNFLVAPSISNAKKIIVIPFISASVNGGAPTRYVNPACSPFGSEPATTSPLLSITNFNVQIAGVNVLQQNIQYTYEAFVEQLMGVNAINGGLSDGLSSGLISKTMFENNYRYYVVDLSRKSKDDISPKSINLIGTNNSLITIDLYIFVEFTRSLRIDVSTGEVNSS